MHAGELFVAVTDLSWFDFLRSQAQLDEVNFWRPGSALKRLPKGTPYLFKLKAPRNVIGGFGFFDYSERMSIAEAWEYYGTRNGTSSSEQLRRLIAANAHEEVGSNREIGCEILSAPTFFAPDQWIALPPDWARSGIQVGKMYALASPIGQSLWQEVLLRSSPRLPTGFGSFGGLGNPTLVVPRRGQATFRRLVISAYDNQCSVSGEHTIPVLQASHIRPFAEEEAHEVQNGISLRSDIHTLFDRGYVTITPDLRFVVSKRLRDNYHNGRVYYELDGKSVHIPASPELRPKREHLEWHGDVVFEK